MAFIAVDKNKEEFIYSEPPIGRIGDEWEEAWCSHTIEVPRGTAEKLTGKPMSWDDEPRELK